MIWTPPLRHLNECKTLNRPGREPSKDWCRHHDDSHRECKHPLDTDWHQSFSGAATAARAVAEYCDCLIPTGVWCDSVRNQRVRKRTRLVFARMKMARCSRCELTQLFAAYFFYP